MNSTPEVMKSIAVAPPNFDVEVVAAAVAEQFGLVGEYALLVSERDQNFRLTTAGNDRYLVKVTCSAEARIVTDFQIAALCHLEKCGFSGVPRVVLSTSGDDRGEIPADDGSLLCLRVLTWVKGRLLDEVEVSPEIASQLGHRLAELDRALETLVHEGDGQASLWDTQRASQLRSLLVHVDDSEIRHQVEAVLDTFDERVKPVLATLARQAIHNDANTENILIDSRGEVSGIIDFGDMLRAPRIIDVSTAAAYLRPDGGDLLSLITPFVAAYHQRSPLSATELDVLFDLIRTRLAITIIIFYWRLAARDKDDPYRKKQIDSEGEAFTFLKKLSDLGRTGFREHLVEKIQIKTIS